MSTIRRLIILACFSLSAPSANSQECPQSIEVDQVKRGHLDSWNASAVTSTHALSGLRVVDGALHYDAAENALLKPISDSEGGYIWTFRGEVGGKQMWMQCIYEGTQVRLERRVDAKASECRVTRDERVAGRAASTHASCGVGSSH